MSARLSLAARRASTLAVAPLALGAPLALWALALGGACIDVPDEREPQCRKTSDCEQAAGEVCEDGVCWGDPPVFEMAAIVGPPGDAKDLVPAEMTPLTILPSGLLPQLALGSPITVRSQVVRDCPMGMPSCPTVPVAATISITRPSSFSGGPGFSLVQQSNADGNLVLYLPLTRPSDPDYLVTISPTDRGATRSTLFSTDAEQLAPRRMRLRALSDTNFVFRLPPVTAQAISGKVLDGAGLGLAGYRVVARGGWVAGEPATEVSTVAVTDADGSYSLQLSDELAGKVLVRAEPPADRKGTATLEIGGVDPSAADDVEFHLPLAERAPVPLPITVKGRDSGGQLGPADGISVRLRYELVEGNQTSRYDVEGTTNGSGLVTLTTVPGVAGTDWTYRLSMLPPADSRLGAVYDSPLVVGAGGAPVVEMPNRVSITGVLLDGTRAMKGVTLSARPSRTFLQSLDASKRTFVGEIAATTATTSKTGEFVVWADQQIAGVPARYSITLQPPDGELVPSWTHAEEIVVPSEPPGLTTVNAGTLYAVDSANVHGFITNPGGRPVAKARVLIYKVDTSCLSDCAGTAQLIGRGVSDDDGEVRIALPKDP